MQKSANLLKVYYISPHLVFSECLRNGLSDVNIDTDIQKNFESLTISLEQKIEDELEFYKLNNITIEECSDFDIILEKIIKPDCTYEQIYLDKVEKLGNTYYKGDRFEEIKNFCIDNGILFYTFEQRVIFINKIQLDRNYHIFKQENAYSVKL
jgi:hypothetical protein